MASFLLQGEKLTVAGGISRVYREGEFLVCCGTFPGHCTVTTPSQSRPFLSLSIELDLALLSRIFAVLPVRESLSKVPALFSEPMSESIADVLLRLIDHATDPMRARFLGPLAVEELHFLLATGPGGD